MASISEYHCCWEGKFSFLSAQAAEAIQRSTCSIYQCSEKLGFQPILHPCLQTHVMLSLSESFQRPACFCWFPLCRKGNFSSFCLTKWGSKSLIYFSTLQKLTSLSHVTFFPRVFVFRYLKLKKKISLLVNKSLMGGDSWGQYMCSTSHITGKHCCSNRQCTIATRAI